MEDVSEVKPTEIVMAEPEKKVNPKTGLLLDNSKVKLAPHNLLWLSY
jgi:hypothetical protein